MRKSGHLIISFLLIFSLLPVMQAKASSSYAIEPKYERVQNFSEGLAAVYANDRWGYVDKKGNVVIPLQYDYALPFHEGLAAVASNGYWGFINKAGEVAIKPQFEMIDIQPDDIGGFSEGLAAVSIDDRWGFVDKSGNIVIKPQYDYAFSFSEGLAAVRHHDKWGYIDKQGKIVIELMYEFASSFSEGAASVYYFDGWGFIDKTGEAFTGFIYPSPSTFKEGLAPVDDGFIDFNGKLVINFLDEHYYDSADPFHDGIAAVYKIMQRELYYGFMDRQGNEIIAPQFPLARTIQFREGRGAINEDDRWGFVDRTGAVVIPPQFEDISGDFKEGLVGVSVNGKWGFIDKDFQSASTNNIELPSSWAIAEVEAALASNLVPDTLNNNYTSHINRQQFSELIVNLFSVVDGSSVDEWMAQMHKDLPENVFEDTDDPVVLAAYQLGIVSGKGARQFDPNGKITRQEAAVMLQRAALKLDMKASPQSSPYADQASIAGWAVDGVMFVAALEDKTTGIAVMSGVANNRFNPAGNYTREQAFITIKRLFHSF